jgi:hypothetical protein
MSLNNSCPPANSLNRSRPSRGTDRENQVGALAAAPEILQAQEAHRRYDGCRRPWLVNGLARIGYNAHSGSEGLCSQRGEHNNVCSAITANDPEAHGGVGVAIPGARYSQGSAYCLAVASVRGHVDPHDRRDENGLCWTSRFRGGYSPSRSAWSRATCTRAGLSALHRSIE